MPLNPWEWKRGKVLGGESLDDADDHRGVNQVL